MGSGRGGRSGCKGVERGWEKKKKKSEKQ
ncbi:hypothetical protein ACFTY7_37295, partial [Streptomyces sp. NPDC057062]